MSFKLTLTSLFALLFLLIGSTQPAPVSAAALGDCLQGGNSAIADLSSWSFNFDCAAPGTAYFAVCDSGSARLDDFFNITYNGAIVASNSGVDGDEDITFGSADITTAGTHVATINSVSDGSGPATVGYSVSTDLNEAFQWAKLFCGTDYNATTPTVPSVPTPPTTPPTSTPSTPSLCVVGVPLFTEDTAPSNGKLIVMMGYGTSNQPEGRTVATWNMLEGQRMNNTMIVVEAPNYVRAWWQAEGSDSWYLMPSQYWDGSGTVSGEYGAACVSAIPSYHTSFASMIAASDVPVMR